jgi:hypothetical protein
VGYKVEAAARQAGYCAAFYNYVTSSRDPFRRGRLGLPASSERAEIYAVTSGFLHFVKTGRLL